MLTRWAVSLAPVSACLLAGCLPDVGSGLPYKVELIGPTWVMITYDTSLTNMGEVLKVAQAECQKYGMDTLPLSAYTAPRNLVKVSFLCVAKNLSNRPPAARSAIGAPPSPRS